MRTLLSVLVPMFLVSGIAFAAGKTTASKKATGISDATVKAAVTEFVDALNSMDDERVLAAIAPSDRAALKGRSDLIGVVYPNKLGNPSIASFEKFDSHGKTLGVLAKVKVEETDPVEGVKAEREKTWFLALDGNTLRVSLTSVWLDAGMVKGAE